MPDAPLLHCSQGRAPRPAGRAAFVDGPPDASFRRGTDVSLCHWLRHPAPAHLQADTATGMALLWLDSGDAPVDVVVATHLAVDAILAAWVLVHPSAAGMHGNTLREAAAMADHFAWGPAPAQVLYLGTTLHMNVLAEQGRDPTDILVDCVAQVTRLLGGLGRDEPRVREGQRILNEGAALVDNGAIERRLPAPHLATYLVPRAVHGDDWARALHIPSFNALVTDRVLMWPHARNRTDRERAQLCSYEAPGGFIHDLWYPGYAWAQPAGLWAPPGILPGTDDAHCLLRHAGLESVVMNLQAEERNNVAWMAPEKLFPFVRLGKAGRKFPVVLGCVDENGVPAPSSHSPQRVTAALMPLFG